MSDDIHADARERYERATEALIRRGWVTRAELKREILGEPAREIYFSPFRNSLVIREGFAMEKRAAEERDRREWIEGVRRRLGLVAEMHRCRVRKVSLWCWAWHCLRPDCTEATVGCASIREAFGEALAHACAFVPEPPEEAPVTELDVLAFDAAWAKVRAEQEAFAARLPDRIADVTELINEWFAGELPDGMRFEWVADGE